MWARARPPPPLPAPPPSYASAAWLSLIAAATVTAAALCVHNRGLQRELCDFILSLRSRVASWWRPGRLESSEEARVGLSDPETPSSDAYLGDVSAVLRELACTERNYVADLRVLCQVRDAFPELPLGNVAALLLLHTELATSLGASESAEHLPTPSAVADAFTKLGPFLRAYTTYVLGSYERLRAVDVLRRRAAGRQRLARHQAAHGC